MTDPFDTLLGDALAPPNRAPDRSFIKRVDGAIAAAERMHAWRRRILRAAASEALVLGALASSALALARLPDVGALLETSPMVPLIAAGIILLAWFALSPRRPGSLAI